MNDGTPLGGWSTISPHGCSADRPHRQNKQTISSKMMVMIINVILYMYLFIYLVKFLVFQTISLEGKANTPE
jgi:hypothetical protein